MMLLFRPLNVWRKNARLAAAAALPGIRDWAAAALAPTPCFHSRRSVAGLTRAAGARNGSGVRRPTRGLAPSEKWQLTYYDETETTMILALRHPSQTPRRNFSSGRRRVPRMKDCRTLKEAIDATYYNVDVLTPRDIAAFWAVVPRLLKQWNGKSSHYGDEQKMNHQLDKLSTLTMKEIETFGYRDLATVALGFAKITNMVGNPGVRFRKGSPHRILRDLLIGQNSDIKQFIFNKIASVAVVSLSEFDARHLSNLFYAYGLAKQNPQFEDWGTLLDVLAVEAISKIGEFNSQELSSMLWAYATSDASNPQLFKAAGDNISTHQDLIDFKPQGLSNIVWAFATTEEPHPQLFKRLADHITALGNLSQFKPQELSNTAWAYATAKESHPQLFIRLADHIIELHNLSQFKPQELSNIAWAYATAEESHPQLFKRLADHIIALGNLSQFKPQDLSNTAWAYATAEETHPQLFKRLADHIISLDNLSQFTPQALSNTVWAFATAKVAYPPLFKRLADHIIKLDNLSQFNSQALSNVVWAYATAKESQPRLFEKLANVAIRKHIEFSSQDIANFLWAFASNGLTDQRLFSSFAPSAASNLGNFNGQNLAIIGWAYAVANVDAPSLFNSDFISACLEKEDHSTLYGLCQLHQWQLWQEELNSNIGLPPSLREKCYKAFLMRAPDPSALQNDVFAELSSLGLKPEEEVLTKCGYRLDALVKANGEKIGIEVDGPSHFINRKPMGKTILKHRQVMSVEEIPLVSIPYWEWNKLRKDGGKKQHYLRSLLHSACKN